MNPDSCFIYKDETGCLFVNPKDGTVNIQLVKENGRTRHIGSIAKNKKSQLYGYYKSEKESDIFRKNNSWSINWNVIQFLPDPSTINIKSETKIFRISKEKALKVGDFLYFKDAGIERKFYIPLDQFEIEPL